MPGEDVVEALLVLPHGQLQALLQDVVVSLCVRQVGEGVDLLVHRRLLQGGQQDASGQTHGHTAGPQAQPQRASASRPAASVPLSVALPPPVSVPVAVPVALAVLRAVVTVSVTFLSVGQRKERVRVEPWERRSGREEVMRRGEEVMCGEQEQRGERGTGQRPPETLHLNPDAKLSTY